MIFLYLLLFASAAGFVGSILYRRNGLLILVTFVVFLGLAVIIKALKKRKVNVPHHEQ